MYQYKYTNDELNLHHFYFEGLVTNENVTKFKTNFLKILNSNKKFYFIIDISKISSFDLNFFISVRSLIDKNIDLVKSWLNASSIIVSSRYSDLLNLLMKLKKSHAPNYITSTTDSAVKFLVKIHQQKIGV